MNLSITELLFLVVIGLLLFGPKKLPEIGRQIGKVMGEFKRASQEFQSQLNEEVRQIEDESKPAPVQPAGTAARGELEGEAVAPEPGDAEHAAQAVVDMDPSKIVPDPDKYHRQKWNG